MPIPTNILKVKRPIGTIVQHSGNKYYVIKRTSIYEPKTKRRVPINLGIVGEIVGNSYIPRSKDIVERKNKLEIKDYGNVMLCNYFGIDVFKDLTKVYNPSDSKKIYTYALLQSIYGDITSRDMELHYNTSFVSELFPGVPMSKNTIGNYLHILGSYQGDIIQFMRNRLDRIDCNTNIIVDGMLKTNNSETNSFSAFSRKGRIKGSKDISIIYAMDYISGEPLASSIYPGNMLDKTAFKDFLSKFDIKKGVLVGDKGFPLDDDTRKTIALNYNKSLRYLIPIKRNLKIINEYNLLNYNNSIKSKEIPIVCKKVKVNDNLYYYSFRDLSLVYNETAGYMLSKNKESLSTEELAKVYMEKKDNFGTIIFESNLDSDLEKIYQLYSHRWDIEILFKYYKNILEFDDVRVQGDSRLIGEEFINFISTIITSRIKNHFDRIGIFKEYSYKQIMLNLSKVKKVKDYSSRIKDPNKLQWLNNIHVGYIDKIIDRIGLDIFNSKNV